MSTLPRLSSMGVRLVSASGWVRCLVLLMFGVAMAGLCWWLVLRDLQHAMPAGSSAAQVDETRRIAARAAVEKAQAHLALASQQKERWSELESALHADGDAQGAWAAVHQASRRHGLRMEHFKPGPVGSELPYPQQRALVRLSGNFDALLAFTRTLADARSPVGLESYLLVSQTRALAVASGQSDAGHLVLEATLLSLHRPVAKAVPAAAHASVIPSRGQGQASVQNTTDLARAENSSPIRAAVIPPAITPGDPFESQRLSSSPASGVAAVNALNSLPLSAMRMVGSVRAADATAALTALVSIGGTLYPVRVGDALGNAHGRVAEIRADRLTVREPGSPGKAQPRAATLTIAKD